MKTASRSSTYRLMASRAVLCFDFLHDQTVSLLFTHDRDCDLEQPRKIKVEDGPEWPLNLTSLLVIETQAHNACRINFNA